MRFKKGGFTMVELLIVLIIIGILVAVAVPLYFANVQRARASEAVGAMGTIRQAEREFRLAHGETTPYLAVVAGNLALPTDGDPAGLNINLGTTQYFSEDAYSVSVAAAGGAGASGMFLTPGVQDFLITATGSESDACPVEAPNCAARGGDVGTYILEMDNSGRIFVTYDGTNWTAW